MKTSCDWIDAVKRRHGLDSDYAVAKLLEVSTSHISHYRNGRSTMDPYMAARVAELLDLEPIQVIACAEAERARDAGKKDFWKRLAACVLIAAGAGSVSLTPAPAQAAGSLHNSGSAPAEYTLCAKRRRKPPSKAASAFAAMAQVLLPISRNRLA